MEDINEKLAKLLSDPSSMAKIQSAMAALGGTDATEPRAETPDIPAPVSAPPPSPSVLGGMPDLSMLSKLAPLMGAFNKEDDDTRLLQALRPYLHGEREHKLDETMTLLRLSKLLPLLQEQGILGKVTERG